MAQRVEEVVLLLASRLVSAQDRRLLEAKHVALSLNALADWCLGILSKYFYRNFLLDLYVDQYKYLKICHMSRAKRASGDGGSAGRKAGAALVA